MNSHYLKTEIGQIETLFTTAPQPEDWLRKLGMSQPPPISFHPQALVLGSLKTQKPTIGLVVPLYNNNLSDSLDNFLDSSNFGHLASALALLRWANSQADLPIRPVVIPYLENPNNNQSPLENLFQKQRDLNHLDLALVLHPTGGRLWLGSKSEARFKLEYQGNEATGTATPFSHLEKVAALLSKLALELKHPPHERNEFEDQSSDISLHRIETGPTNQASHCPTTFSLTLTCRLPATTSHFRLEEWIQSHLGKKLGPSSHQLRFIPGFKGALQHPLVKQWVRRQGLKALDAKSWSPTAYLQQFDIDTFAFGVKKSTKDGNRKAPYFELFRVLRELFDSPLEDFAS
ncbi:MAG: hypothetical protein VYA34_11495 [Myxococcota bacterium]|nr:hypothetical protein [Myxococcota bacterium]